MEIERKYLIEHIEDLPENYQSFPFCEMEQGYLCTSPVVRVRREDNSYYLTYKGKGLLAREEYNLPLTKEAYEHLLPKSDGIILKKRRYKIPLSAQNSALIIELDIFESPYQGLILAEVEFPAIEEANTFVPPAWFGRDVTFSGEYQNSKLSTGRP